MQQIIVFAILLWFIHISEQTVISRRHYSKQVQTVLPEIQHSTEDQQQSIDEINRRSKRLSDSRQTGLTYRNPFAAFLKRKRHSKSTDSRLSLRKDYTNGDSKCGLMCHLLCRPGCSKICYSTCT
ncbi:unnamed protein product [Heterobilharzia americana]|nr:unnamed protein product [Heterobilharzia americana]CAH8455735.1 unnamed protein product [Heterobilharzia americana]